MAGELPGDLRTAGFHLDPEELEGFQEIEGF